MGQFARGNLLATKWQMIKYSYLRNVRIGVGGGRTVMILLDQRQNQCGSWY